MCMGGRGAPALKPQQMPDKVLQQRADQIIKGPPTLTAKGVGAFEANDKKFYAAETDAKKAYETRQEQKALPAKPSLAIGNPALRVSAAEQAVQRMTKREPLPGQKGLLAGTKTVPMYAPGTDEYFRAVADQAMGGAAYNNPYERAAKAKPYTDEIANRAAIKADLEQQAADQKQIIDEAEAEKKRLSDEADAAQEQKFQDLKAKQDASMKDLAARSLASQAAGQSLRILAMQGSQAKAPTAQMEARGKQRRRMRSTAPGASLRIGESRQGSGVGVNLGG